MAIEIKVPSVGESVTEALLAQWYKQDGDRVQKDELLFLIETDKVTLEVVAEADGILKITAAEGETVSVGAVVGIIDTDVEPLAKEAPAPPEEILEAPPPPPEPAPTKAPPLTPPVTSEQPEAPPISVAERADIQLSPAVRRLIAEKNLNVNKITGTLRPSAATSSRIAGRSIRRRLFQLPCPAIHSSPYRPANPQ